MHMHKQSTAIKRWKLDNNEGWKQYNKLQQKNGHDNKPNLPNTTVKRIESIQETFGEVTIRNYAGKT